MFDLLQIQENTTLSQQRLLSKSIKQILTQSLKLALTILVSFKQCCKLWTQFVTNILRSAILLMCFLVGSHQLLSKFFFPYQFKIERSSERADNFKLDMFSIYVNWKYSGNLNVLLKTKSVKLVVAHSVRTPESFWVGMSSNSQ